MTVYDWTVFELPRIAPPRTVRLAAALRQAVDEHRIEPGEAAELWDWVVDEGAVSASRKRLS